MSTLTLSIPQVSLSDNGPIVCIADNGIGSSATASLNLTVLFAPELQISSNNLEIVIGNDITLVCSSSGRHLPHISWTTPGPTSDRYVISSTPVNESFLISQFTISNSQSVDTGLYNCTAENSVDNSTGSIFLQVLEPAEIVNHTTDSEVIIADSVTVFCEVKGIYTPTIVWTKDGVAYQNSSGITILENIGINGTVYSALIIYSFTRADSGVYSCSATNSAGSDEASFELTIQVYPVIESFPSDIVVTITDSTSLTCTASGVPLPSIMWYKLGHGQLVNGADYSISTSGIGTQLSMSVLTIVAAIQGDTGLYNCTAVNDIGSSSVSFHLQVNEPPEITDIVFIVGPEVIVGDLTEIQCTAFGIPAPSISWEATDDAITSGSNSTGNMSTLTLSIPQVSISDNGPIVCIADNGIGSSATASLNLTVLFAPELQISSNNLEIVIGNDITLVCSSSGRHLPHISWTTPGPTSDRYVISSTPVNESFLISQFTISNSQSVDTGLYNCTAENSVDNSTGSIFLQVLEPAEIVNHTTDSEVIIADSVTVFCEVKGIYTPTIVWTKDGVAYQNSSGITILENIGINGTVYSALIIDTFTRADSGMYSCSASNSAGSDEASFELTIQEPAMVVVYPEDTVVLAGDSILLTCIGYGIPTPLLHWQRDGINIVEDDSKYFITETTVVVDNTVFVMSSLSLCNSSEVNSGEYSCTANNEIRVPATENFTITIKTIAPVILMYPNDTPVTTHSTVSLACTVFGAPLPSVVWSWNRRNNESINNSVPITIEDTSVIRIGALYLIHSVLNICGFSLYAIGDYSCSAESYAGQTVATTALSLEVPANIAVVPNDTSLYVGQTVTLSCVGYGLPLPTITWSKDHQPLRAPYLMNESEIVTEHVTFLRSTLTLCSLKLPDDGQYSCSSTNNLSTTLENFTINIKVEPQIVIFPNDSIFFAGSTVRLSCTGYGILLPSIVWNRGGFNLDSISVNDSRMEIWDETVVVGEHQFIRSYLQICSTVESDSEVYTCTAMTSERQNGVDFRVEVVSVPATLIKTPESVDIIAEMGTSIVANCIAYGNPAPTITWSLLSTPYSDIVATNTTILTTSTNSSIYTRQFVVNRVGIVYSSLLICPGHHAALTTSHILCSANNGVDAGGNVSSHSFTINVTVEPKVFDDPIHHDGFVTETISLVCRADGIPLPTTIVWLKDDCSLTQYIEHLARFQVTVSHIQGFRSHVPEAIESVLTISESMERDSGSYSCRATNEINTAYLPVEHKVIVNAAPVTVDICSTVAVTLCLNGGTCITRGNSYSCVCRDGWVGTQCDKSEALLSAPVLLSPPQTIFVERFSEKVLDCNVIGNPEPLITWYKDGLEMIGATQKNLIIDEVDLLDRAAYQCTAVNNRGNVTSDTAYVNIRGIAQYMVSVHMRYDDISTVKKWFDVYGEETVMRVDSGNMTSVLCVKFMNTTLEGVWNVFITLQSLGGEELMLTQVTDSLTSLFDRAAEELENELTVKEVVRLDGCVEDITVVVLNSISNDSYLELHWPEQSFGSLVEIGCPCEAATLPLMANRRCAGNFEGVVEWEKPEDSQCHFSDMTKILCDLPDSNKLAVVTNDAEDLGTLEIFLGAVNIKIFSNETDAKNTSRSDNVLATIDHLLSAPSEILRRSQEEFNSSSLILEGLREVIDSYPLLEIPPLKLIAKTFTAIVDFNFDLETFAGTSATFSNTVEASGSGLGNDNEDTGSITSSVTLSGDLVSILNNEPDTRISFVMYTSEGLFSEREEFVIENNLTTLVLGSTAVLEARLSNDAVVSGIEDIVTLVFSKNEVAQENGSMSSCVFWNQSLDEGYGGWSGVGCRLLQENDVMATCTCDHLTSFALIVDTTPSEPSTPEDRGIGSYVYIGSIFSTVFLLLNIMTLLCTRSEWRRAIGVFLLNGCISLILLNLVYIAAGYSSSLSDQSCFGVSVVFHYIFLVAVCSLAGLVLTNLRQKNKKKSSTKSCMTVSAVTLMTLIWCLPGVIVALTVSLSHDAYNNANEFCRPVNSAFHYGLILPWGLVHVPAIVCLLLAPCPCLSNTLREHVRRSWLREYTAIVLTLVLFDVSWGLGLPATHPLHVGNLRFIGQIVFCVANGCIGLVLFIFFSVLSKSVRKTCGISLALKRGRENSDWQKQSGLYKSSKKDEKENSDCENMAVKSDVKAAEEEKPVITFHYDLNEVYGNPAKMTDEEEFAFESETQFS